MVLCHGRSKKPIGHPYPKTYKALSLPLKFAANCNIVSVFPPTHFISSGLVGGCIKGRKKEEDGAGGTISLQSLELRKAVPLSKWTSDHFPLPPPQVSQGLSFLISFTFNILAQVFISGSDPWLFSWLFLPLALGFDTPAVSCSWTS